MSVFVPSIVPSPLEKRVIKLEAEVNRLKRHLKTIQVERKPNKVKEEEEEEAESCTIT